MNKKQFNDFKSYLEQNIFKEEITLTPLTKGGTSLNFLSRSENSSVVIKLLFTKDQERIRKMYRILKLFANQKNLYAAHLVSVSGLETFTYQEYTGFFINHINGQKISFSKLNPVILDQIFDNYQHFLKIDFSKEDFISPIIRPAKIYDDNKSALSEAYPQAGFVQKLFFKKFAQANVHTFARIVLYSQKTSIIHGDATLNNMLVDQDGKIAFLDFEFIREGYLIEDFTKLVLSGVLQHHIFSLPKNQLLKIVKQLNCQYGFQKSDWQYGIYLYVLEMIRRRTRKPKALKSFRKNILFLLHLKKIESFLKLIEQHDIS